MSYSTCTNQKNLRTEKTDSKETNPAKNATRDSVSFLQRQNRCWPMDLFTTLNGEITNIFAPVKFKIKSDGLGLVQLFLIVDTLARPLEKDVWRFKITAWSSNVSKLMIEVGKCYPISHCKVKPTNNSTNYPGQADYELHTTRTSKITETSQEIPFSV